MGVLTPTVSPPTSAPIPLPTMAMAGVELAEECTDVYEDILINKKYPYAIFLIADGKIQVEAKGEKDGSSEEQYARFLNDLQKKDGDRDDCRSLSKQYFHVNIHLYFIIHCFTQFNLFISHNPHVNFPSLPLPGMLCMTMSSC